MDNGYTKSSSVKETEEEEVQNKKIPTGDGISYAIQFPAA